MNTRLLLGLVVGAVLLVIGAFFVFSPIAQNAQEARMVQFQNQNQDTQPTTDTTDTTQTTPTETSAPVDETTPTSYTLAEVALHSDKVSCWTVIDGSVYDLTPFIFQHPGGAENIMRICGKDGTQAFSNQHGGGNEQQKAILATSRIGALSN